MYERQKKPVQNFVPIGSAKEEELITKMNRKATERKYPLTKETLERMLSLRLVAGTTSEDAYTLLRFIQKQIDEHGSHDGGEKDL
ncbi:hypothetical protein Tco_0149117 [Tanacetum coccineum]